MRGHFAAANAAGMPVPTNSTIAAAAVTFTIFRTACSFSTPPQTYAATTYFHNHAYQMRHRTPKRPVIGSHELRGEGEPVQMCTDRHSGTRGLMVCSL